MKFFYMAPVFINKQKLDGVGKKVLNHYFIFQKHYDSWLAYYGETGVVVEHAGTEKVIPYKGRHRRFALYEEVGKLYEKEKFEYTYIRYPKSENNLISLLKVMENLGSKIIVEIPTYPYNGKMSLSVRTIAIAIGDAFFRTQLKKYVGRIVTYSDDDSIFGIRTIRTVNGIVFDRVKKHVYSRANDAIELISVATNYSCHGFDRVISGMEEYYQRGGKENIIFNVVGAGPAVKDYKKQLEQFHLKDRVILHGFLDGAGLDELYNKSLIAVNSLALHRLGLTKESTLKTKEYAAKGLPVISSTEVDAFDEEGNQKYVMLVEDDDSNIKIEDIIKFYHRVYDNTTPEEISSHIREASQKVCDMDVTLQGTLDYYGEFL